MDNEEGKIPDKGYINTDKEIWRRIPGDCYSPSIHVTEHGAIGINIGGRVKVAPLEEWFGIMFPGSEFVKKEE